MKRVALILFAFFLSFVSSAAIDPIIGLSGICINSSDTLTDLTPGGTWSSSNLVIGTIDSGTGILTGLSAGTTTITYTVGASYVTKTVIVYPAPALITGPNPTSVCVGGEITLYNATPGGGSWFLICAGGTSIYFSTPNSATIHGGMSGDISYVYFVDTNGCQSNVINVHTIGPMYPISGSTIINVGSTTTLSNSMFGGVWSSSNPSIASIGSNSGIVTGLSVGTTTISYNAGPCNTSAVVTVLPPAKAPIYFTRKNEIYIYPNPTIMSLNITSNDRITTLAICNLLGQEMDKHEYNSKEIQIDISNLPAGMYLIRINETEVRKFVKE